MKKIPEKFKNMDANDFLTLMTHPEGMTTEEYLISLEILCDLKEKGSSIDNTKVRSDIKIKELEAKIQALESEVGKLKKYIKCVFDEE